MDEALDFILESTIIGKSSEIFVPKLKAYSIMNLKKALVELIDDPGEEIIGIRPGEKLHETLISVDEMRYTWELDNKYVILTSSRTKNKEKDTYPKIKKKESSEPYSSDLAEKISKDELKKIISQNILPTVT
jgi:FlaA1/EpsC-like NDP-sugar epimerase